MRNQEGIKIELQKKSRYKYLSEGQNFFLAAHPPFYVTFCCFLYLLHPPSQVMHLLNGPIRIHNITMRGKKVFALGNGEATSSAASLNFCFLIEVINSTVTFWFDNFNMSSTYNLGYCPLSF